MNKQLAISDSLSLPLDAATQTFAFIARKGAGKTYAAGKLAELLMDAGVQCCVLDTVGNWYGLRIAADGKGQGFDIPVLGGLRGDIPLEPTGGELVADLVVETGRSVILDLSQFSQADRKRFATAFGNRLWQRKKAEHSPSPLHLFIEESQLIIPQMVRGDDARMVGIFEEIIRLGRNYGIGVSMISQRPQSVNKEVLTQTECLVALQVNGAPERKALKEWIVHQGLDVNLVEQLPGLPVGTAYVWSPQWLRILQKVQISKKRTFDASATPKVGESRVQRDPAPLDLAAFKVKMAATIERAKENDPGELKRNLADLKRKLQLAERKQPATKQETIEVPIISASNEAALQNIGSGLNVFLKEHAKASKLAGDALQALIDIRQLLAGRMARPPAPRPVREAIPTAHRIVHGPSPRAHSISTGELISGGLRRMMVALAQRPGLNKRQLGVRAGLSSTSGTFGTYLGRMRSSGWIHGTDVLELTPDGLHALGKYDPLPEGQELLNYWLNELGNSGAGRMLSALAAQYPHALSKEQLGEAAEISHMSGTFGTYLGKLRNLELVEGRGELRASREFFE